MIDRMIDAVIAALPAGAAAVEVAGDGELASALRARVAAIAAPAGSRPAVVIETTGDGAAVQAALRRVADLGTVVLAGPPPAVAVALDLYGDLHVRGLTLVGTPGPGAVRA